jgi:hypothetical protein
MHLFDCLLLLNRRQLIPAFKSQATLYAVFTFAHRGFSTSVLTDVRDRNIDCACTIGLDLGAGIDQIRA